LGDHTITYESVGVGLLKDSSLMGTFPTPLPPNTHHIATIDMISSAAYYWPLVMEGSEERGRKGKKKASRETQ
jgi:hypothetical protein